jgi:1-acyl-sn-glycerol-3-phosphate acyltransferase
LTEFKNSHLLNPLRVTKRGIFVIAHVVLCVFMLSLLRLRLGREWYLTRTGQNLAHWWMRHLTRMLGIRIYQHGSPPVQHALYVGNHVSFLDILITLSVTQLNFLSKNSVRYWPVVGFITSVAGTLFIKRSKRRRLASVIDLISTALQQGRSVMVFPEGTTTLGREPAKFHSGLFQAAINSQSPVQAVAIRYLKDGQLDRDSAYIDNDNLLVSLYRIMRRPKTEAHLTFCQPFKADGMNRTEMASKARQQIIDAFSQQLVSSPATLIEP